ncbi:Uncharacterised protein [Salmonella enterica subsp. arizonae]|uniref:Uncharacterized protein n=1 Tax=Salmonella enterica subsp. arizonae TaxID=59203 RepID=A0A379S3X6_SALER|nr:Uncharacterised protein [Salmonella enterica subsp. arizonae]
MISSNIQAECIIAHVNAKFTPWDDSNLKKWQSLGFESLNHYLTYNAMNNTMAGARGFDELFHILEIVT